MAKTVLILLAIICCAAVQAQTEYFILKKRNRTIQYFYKESHITFQTADREWISGIIKKITKDSFYLTLEIIRYGMLGNEYLHFSGFRYAVKDIYALPTKKQIVYYRNDRVQVIPGHEKFVWLRNGFLLQVGGGGYVALNVINDLTRNDPPFAKRNLTGLGIGAGLFLIGTFLHMKFDPFIHPGRKYHMEYVFIPGTK